MPQLPSKLQSGDNFKGATVRTVNNIIDYLQSQRLQGDNRTVKLNQYANGITISAINNAVNKPVASGSFFIHPFQLYTTTDESKRPQVCMREGRVLMQSLTNAIFYLRYEKVDANDRGSVPIADFIPVDWSTAADGDYCIVGAVFNAEDEQGEYIDSACLVCGGQILVQHLPCVSGYYSYYIGTVTKKTVENPKAGEADYSLAIGTQRITSDISITDYNNTLPFTFKAFINHGDDAEIKMSFDDFSVDKVIVNSGKVYDDNNQICEFITDECDYIPNTGENTCCIKIYGKENDAGQTEQKTEIFWTSEPVEAYVKDANGNLTERYIMLAKFYYEVPLAFFNFHPCDVMLGKDDTYKVLVTDTNSGVLGDTIPDFLVDKIAGDEGTISGDEEWKIGEGEQASTPKGYIGFYEKRNTFAEDEKNVERNRLLYAKWLYNKIGGFGEKYLTLNCQKSIPQWQSMGMIRVADDDEEPAGFLPEKVKGGDHINTKVEEKQLVINAEPPTITGSAPIIVEATGDDDEGAKWNFDVKIDKSEFITGLTGGECITVEAGEQEEGTESSETGKSFTISVDINCILDKIKIEGGECITVNKGEEGYTVEADIDCIFENLSITGDAPISVSGSGTSWNISFDDSEFIKDIQGNECINVSRSGTSATVSTDINCIFSNLQISGSSPITVSGSGTSWNIGFDDSGFIKGGNGSSCINVSKSGSNLNISADIDCIFSNLNITGESPISVSGSGKNWSVGIDDSKLVENVTGGECITTSRSGKIITVNADIDCILSNLSITGDDYITVTRTANDFQLEFNENQLGKIKVTSIDSLDYICNKWDSAGSVVIYDHNGIYISAGVKAGTIKSDNGSIKVEEDSVDEHGTVNTFDLKVDWTKVEIDSSLAPLVTADYSDENKVVLKLTEMPDGVMYVKDGQISFLGTQAKSVLATDENGGLTWLAYSDCENACGGE